MALSERQQQFVDMLMPSAIEASRRTGIDPRIIVAQAAQETGWGRSAPNNNFFGIKSHGQGGGGSFSTREFINGQWVTVNDSFRGYQSPEDSVRGYADFILQNPRYKPFMSASGDFDKQLEELQASGYATDPGYSSSVGSIARNIPYPSTARAPALNAINVAAPQVVPRRPQGIGFAPPPQRPGGIGGLVAGLGNFAGNVAAGVQSAVPPRQDIINAFINQGVRDFWSNPDMRPTVSQGGAYPVQTVSNQGYGISGLDFGSTSTAWGEDPVERNIRMANSDAIRAVTGSGAITQDAINQALSSGATLVRRI